MDIRNCDGIDLLNTIQDGLVDLFLTDPPYIISRESGMNKLRDAIDSDQDLSKTEDEWKVFLEKNKDVKMAKNAKENFLKYGTMLKQNTVNGTRISPWENSKNSSNYSTKSSSPVELVSYGSTGKKSLPWSK